MNILKNPKTPNMFAQKNTGASVSGKPATAMAAAREQLSQEMPKMAKSKAEIIMDKIATIQTRLISHVSNKAKLIAEAAKSGIHVTEKDGRLYYEHNFGPRVSKDDAYGFMGKKRMLEGNAFSKKGSFTNKA